MILRREEHRGVLAFWCPGCRCTHELTVGAFKLTGTMEKPTIRPAFQINGKCHVMITDGALEYLLGCNHTFKARTIPMVPLT